MMHHVALMRPADLAGRIEHTLLRPEATAGQIDQLCDEAVQWGFAAVCVNPVFVARAAGRLRGQAVVTCGVVGFPLGADGVATKLEQARRAVQEGATHVDMVVHLGALLAEDEAGVCGEISAVSEAVHGVCRGGVLKVILETAALERRHIELGCRCALRGGADWVKTSTGFHPAGGASVEAVRLLRELAWPLPVKAAGGIRRLAEARAMLEAGASRLGTSASVAIIQEMAGP
jgi:deoxyribose-phosphate aldolase